MTDAADDTSRQKVGYRNPPQHTRFKPGQSGNPRGRPRGQRNLTTFSRLYLELWQVPARAGGILVFDLITGRVSASGGDDGG